MLTETGLNAQTRHEIQDIPMRSEKALEALLNATTEAACLLDIDGCLIILNQKMADNLGGSMEDLIGRCVFDYLPPDTARDRKGRFLEVIRARAAVQFEDERDGRYFTHSVYPVFDEQDNVEAVAVYAREITDNKRAEDRLRWEYLINSALSELYLVLISPSSSIEEVAEAVLETTKRLTESRDGYVAEIDPLTGNAISHTLTRMMDEYCAVTGENRKAVFSVGPGGKYSSLWGHALNTREAFFTNSAGEHPASRGLPKGHVPIESFLSVPVLMGDELVGQIALANPDKHYSDQELDAVRRIARYYALAIQRKRAEAALRQAHDLLERRVEERTGELATANIELQREIIERARAEQEATASEARFRAIVETARDCVFMKDRSLRYVLVNPAMEQLLEIPAEKIVGMKDRELYGERAGRHLEEVDLRVLNGELIEEEHTRRVRGIPTTFLDIKAPVRDSQGNITGLCGIARDITGRRSMTELPETDPSQYPSAAIRLTMAQARLAAQSDSIVLLTGESGSGKDYVARYIHNNSKRASGRFFGINCAAVPPELAESELFGHEPGAFTGARARSRGLLELAEGGTLLLNEIGELHLPLQAKLLTFFDTRTFTRVGGRSPISVNARIVAATNRNLEEDVARGRFRADLFYRLNVMSIRVPPLRERLEDIPVLVRQIVPHLAAELRLPEVPEVDSKMCEDLASYHWPGNVRELRNVLERALLVSGGKRIELESVHWGSDHGDWVLKVVFPQDETFDEVTRQVKRSLIQEALRRSRGTKKDAADLLGISRHAMKRYLKSLGLESG